MATINYVTLKFPQQLLQFTEVIQDLPFFKVLRYKHRKGVIFRIPHGVKVDDVCHFFIEHEINLTNTIKTGTLTMKAHVTVVPCHMGVFSGFEHLAGSYNTDWEDEDGYSHGYDHFTPDYSSDENVKRIVPLPVNIKTNLYEYLNEIIFSQVDDLDVISKYAVHLGCQKQLLKDKVVYTPTPVNTGSGKNALAAHQSTMHLFEMSEHKDINLIPKQIEMPYENRK